MNAVSPTLDFELLFRSLPGAHLVLAPDLTIVAVSDAYLAVTMTEREGLLGRKLFEVFPDNPDDPAADGVRNLQASLDRVRKTLRPDRLDVQKYDIRRPAAEGGGFEARFWSPINTATVDADGKLVWLLHTVEDVTDKMLLEAKRSEDETAYRELSLRAAERYRQLLDAAPDAIIVVDETGTITLVNDQAEALFGYPRAELIGGALEMLVPTMRREAHARHVKGFLDAPHVRSMGIGRDLYGLRKDGVVVPIEVSLSPLRTESGWSVCAAVRDISQRRHLEGAAKLYADRLAAAIENVEAALAVFDAAGRLVLCNSTYRVRLGGVMPGTLVGRRRREIDEAWAIELVFDSAADRERFIGEGAETSPATLVDLRTRAGDTLRVIRRRTPDGGVVESIWDRTVDARREEELRIARVAADAANAAKSEFLSSMSHELRTPLNAILGFSQLGIRDTKEPPTERQRARLQQIQKGGEHLLHLIDDILDLSRIETGQLSFSIEEVSVVGTIEELLTTLAPAAARAEVKLALVHSAPVPTVHADRTRFVQILMNLGSNAIKYNRRGGTVTLAATSPRPGRVRITVTDTGIGVPSKHQAKLFQAFERAGQENGPIEGTGIGLAITRRLAEAMGGEVGFSSVPGEGSEFWIELPAHVAAVPAERPPSALPTSLPLSEDRRGVVLYVEDNPSNVDFMRELLSVFDGIELVTSPTAERGLELVRERKPDIVILDINLPGMSGIDALRELKSSSETRSIPVIALSAAASERDRKRGVELGFYRYLTKPVDVAELEGVLEALLADVTSSGRTP